MLLLLGTTLALGAPPAPDETAAAEPTPRDRAAWSMLGQLDDKAVLMVKHLPDNIDNGCPTDIAWVTWGMAKTDPWGNDFQMKCDDSTGRKALFSSSGPDGMPKTADDIIGWEPLVEATACVSGCERLRICAGKSAAPDCQETCKKAESKTHFRVDTCGLLADCTGVESCVGSALRGYGGMADCKAFGVAAASTFGGNKAAVAKLKKVCEADLLHVPELVCVEDSKTALDASLCHLTVDRRWATDIGGSP